MMDGILKGKKINLQRNKLRHSMEKVNPLSVALRSTKAVERRHYSVRMSNSLWHMDGHMKLIRWGIVTHGAIDGYSRLITYLNAGTNNKAATVLKSFVRACQEFGVPSRVRSDFGGENVMVALFMNLVNGGDRNSHLCGRSVNNQRIERLWRDVHQQVTSKFYNTFYAMEDSGKLDPENDIHICVLHSVFLPQIRDSLEKFRQGWNNHRLSTEKNRTPHQIWLDGILGNINSASTEVANIFAEPMSDRFRERLIAHGVDPSTFPSEDSAPNTSPLTNESIEAMLLFSSAEQNPETRFLKCLDYLTQPGNLNAS